MEDFLGCCFNPCFKGLFILFDLKAVSVLLKIRAVCVDYELHNY